MPSATARRKTPSNFISQSLKIISQPIPIRAPSLYSSLVALSTHSKITFCNLNHLLLHIWHILPFIHYQKSHSSFIQYLKLHVCWLCFCRTLRRLLICSLIDGSSRVHYVYRIERWMLYGDMYVYECNMKALIKKFK